VGTFDGGWETACGGSVLSDGPGAEEAFSAIRDEMRLAMSGASIRTTLAVSGSARAVGAEAAAAQAGGNLTCVDMQSGGSCAVTSGGPNGGFVAFGGLWRRPQPPPGKRRLGIWQEGGKSKSVVRRARRLQRRGGGGSAGH